jgi:hypothetical protein
MEGVAIEAGWVSRALTGDDLRRCRKARDEREVPGTLDQNAFRPRQRLRQALAMILRARQVVILRGIDKRGNRDPCQRIVRELHRVRRHENYGPDPRIAELREVADLASSFPSGNTPAAAELGVVGMLAAMRGL